ncbi:hypothetical protein SAMN05421858_2587 [Haladaptatus litoreus]|uniref:Uncharacterized protein n=1 Tax=Haladaptatus litoreus TaxID=553468 RepID=A0A1N7BJ60_9EURY|nr:hypothetical protein [Haladaptatus litoreus]SIR51405.1 hypothetical protein SAMN05421858_2587 [Haladaptatus litoreus]
MRQSPLSEASDDRLLDMLFAGEDIEEEIELDGARIAVTSHRVLAFMPEGGGRRFDHADRPNVLNASVQPTGHDSYLSWVIRSVVYGIILLGGGFLINSSGILVRLGNTEAPNDQIIGGVGQMISSMAVMFGILTDAFLLIGGVLLFVGFVLGALYFVTRSEELVIERAGREPIYVPVNGKEAEDAARRIRTTLGREKA